MTPLASHIAEAATALAKLAYACEKGLPEEMEGMEVLPGYPFPVSLEELIAEMQAWAERMHDAGL